MTTPESLRADLGKIAKGQVAAGDATANLRRSAEERMEQVDARLAELQPKAITDAGAGEEYQALIEERGTLARVLGVAGA
jgi:hypothetical protein